MIDKRFVRRLSLFFLCLSTLVPLHHAFCAPLPKKTFDAKNAVRDSGSIHFFARKAQAVVSDMGLGWNLGNCFESDGAQGLEPPSREAIRALAASGVKTLRIPVSWHGHIIDGSYTIDPAWMLRVKEVVDWALGEGMYVILCMHHDNAAASRPAKGTGFYPDVNSKLVSGDFLVNVWAQIALAFNNGYDYHLVFELLDAPRLIGTRFEYDYRRDDVDCLSSMGVIREYEQLCLDTIRASRGNNKKRIVLVPAYGASADAALSGTFFMPEDVADDRTALSVHLYLPAAFAVDVPGASVLTQDFKDVIASYFSALYEKFVVEQIPVVVTECGATNKDNISARESWFSCFFAEARRNDISCVLWDNGVAYPAGDGDASACFGLFDRDAGRWYFPSLLDAALQSEPAQ